MPFVKKGDITAWREPTVEHVVATRKKIAGPKEEDEGQEIKLVGVQEKVEQALSTMIPSYGRSILERANNHFYSAMASFVLQGEKSVDIVVPVYNAIHIAEKCINSVLTRTVWPYHLYIMDDASDWKTKEVLGKLASDNPEKITLTTNKKNKGFAATVNRGMRASKGNYVLLLNSDVLVTQGWLTKLVMALESDPKNQIVNPATNNTAVIDVPMSPGASYLQMNRVFQTYTERRYPEVMPTGFCFLFRRALLSKIGYMDEGYENYGEETDFWMKALTHLDDGRYPQWRAILADDTYCFHERGSSFSVKGEWDWLELRKIASHRFHSIWPQFAGWRRGFDEKKTLKQLRAAISAPILNNGVFKYKVCWVVHSASFCGAMKYICDVVNEINERGGDARVALIPRKGQKIQVLSELRTAPVVFENEEDFLKNFTSKVWDKGLLVASTVEQTPLVDEMVKEYPNLRALLHVQSYEPLMTNDKEQQADIKKNFRLIPRVISNSNWITKELKDDLGINPIATLPVGVDQKLFYPRDRDDGDERPTVMLPMIKSYKYKGYDRGAMLINAIFAEAASRDFEVRVLTYGNTTIPECPESTDLGALSQIKLAESLGTQVDVFLDPAKIHSYGMPALEALASGAVVVGWDNYGIKEYIKDQKNGRLVKRRAPIKEVATLIVDLLQDKAKRVALTKPSAIAKTLKAHDRETSVSSFIHAIEETFELHREKRRIVFMTPHLRKHGGPTTIVSLADAIARKLGHEVSITSVHPDVNPDITGRTNLPINLDITKIPECDVIISNSDNPINDKLFEMPQIKKKIMLKLSHNPRFKQLEDESLKLPWDKVITTTEWLKDACENPLEDWTHPAVPATKVGWYHYGHDEMKCPPANKVFRDIDKDPVVIGTLVHHHPSKGSSDGLAAFMALKDKYGDSITCVGVGEVDAPAFKKPDWMGHYVKSPNRDLMAQVLGQFDIWLGASHGEGLGRMALEAMSASVACVLTDTNAEFAKHDDNCLIVPVSDVAAMIEAVSLLVENRDFRREMGISAYSTAEEASDSEKHIEAINRAIEGLFK